MKTAYIMIFSLIAALAVLAFFTWDDIKTTRIRAALDAEEKAAQNDKDETDSKT